jgi:hypothetical protein
MLLTRIREGEREEVTGGWTALCNEGLQYVCPSPNLGSRVIKDEMSDARREMINIYKC